MTRQFEILPDVNAVAAASADALIATGRNAIRRRGRFLLALSGGSTPLAVCPYLVVPPRVAMLDWTKVEFFFGDERAVPPDHAASNYDIARRALLDYLPHVSMDQVHRMHAESDDLDRAAADYEAEMRDVFGVHDPAGRPRFDLIWLGMGADGHTASLFPGSEGLTERTRWVVANWAPGRAAWRLTLTFPVLNAARRVMFVATGAEKADALQAIRAGRSNLPAARVRARRTTWLVDRAAAGSASA